MSQIAKKFIGANQVDDTKIRLLNNAYMRSRNAADSADVNMFKVNASDAIEAASLPVYSGSPFATQSYVDGAVGGSGIAKQAVVAVSTANITLSGEQTIDGVAVVTGDRVLVAGQTTGANNGIYIADSGSWTRSTDADASAEVKSGISLWVNQGTAYNNTRWTLDTVDPITLGSTSLSFVKETRISKKENLTLNGTDITNQYKDLAFTAIADSLDLSVNGNQIQVEGTDYSLSVVGGVTRVTFLNDLATGGAAALISGDILHVKYQR